MIGPIEIQYTEQELLRAANAHFWRTKVAWIAVVFFGVIPIATACLGYFYSDLCQSCMSVLDIGTLLLAPIGMFAGFRFLTWRSVRQVISTSQSALLSFSISFTESGISIDSSNSNSRFEWNQLFKILETGEYFFFYINSMQYYFVPKKRLGEESKKELRALIHSSVADKRMLKLFTK